jgi:hypothetical protein
VSNNRNALRLCAALALGLGLSLPAAARTFCCTDKTGHRVCGDTMPEQCSDRAVKEFDGTKIRTLDAPLTAEQRAQRDADAARKKEQERLASDQRRRDNALLNTYSSEKDIDAMRDRALANLQEANKQAQEKYDAALKRKKALEKEVAFYTNKPVPANLKAQIKENETELAAQQTAVEERKKEAEAVRTRFEDDRKRYRELTHSPATR